MGKFGRKKKVNRFNPYASADVAMGEMQDTGEDQDQWVDTERDEKEEAAVMEEAAEMGEKEDADTTRVTRKSLKKKHTFEWRQLRDRIKKLKQDKKKASKKTIHGKAEKKQLGKQIKELIAEMKTRHEMELKQAGFDVGTETDGDGAAALEKEFAMDIDGEA
uniref:Uncharacterized protein n=1 Tax=Chromera velia CCMP2878 TaxID=1169474 RepID=A0A0G4ICC6_9ALVE|mmetsp:Transcript_39644/g.78059  ORF Transcript_39644/g.78059 Transcript_39644/m.78059 type:complete len:162 (+) Transcript_39644:1770-2255(+)|eukprot:Cvel_12984.t1-p1 / transcript=Cvel_12984.t1 / gene=Cvel_12984 / organism=Chromera_velia_CCMP2878 / gene_product=hypothetical protein / transcript_product=hypothetical protein / location=Cvel_scaffold870:34107-38053(-) / protein_length=161 / sequence_SO=supercontig / SO=protein_coding / is_pseudo=false